MKKYEITPKMNAQIKTMAKAIMSCLFDDKQAKKMRLDKVKYWLNKNQKYFNLLQQKALSSSYGYAYEIQNPPVKVVEMSVDEFIEDCDSEGFWD